MRMVEVRHRASEALQKPSMHETAGHESRLWIFDPVSGRAADKKHETNAPSLSAPILVDEIRTIGDQAMAQRKVREDSALLNDLEQRQHKIAGNSENFVARWSLRPFRSEVARVGI